MAFGVTAEQVRVRRTCTGRGMMVCKAELERAAAMAIVVDATDRGEIKPDLGAVLQWLVERAR